MAAAKWTVGQAVVIASGDPRARNTAWGATVTKVGRLYVTTGEGYLTRRFYLEDGAEHVDAGYAARLFPNMQSYEADRDNKAAWDELQTFLRTAWRPPAHVEARQVRQFLRYISKTPETDNG